MQTFFSDVKNRTPGTIRDKADALYVPGAACLLPTSVRRPLFHAKQSIIMRLLSPIAADAGGKIFFVKVLINRPW